MVLVGIALALVSCGREGSVREPVIATWVVGQALPPFDPQGPPDPVCWAIERLLSRGLVAEDSSGAIVPAAAQRWSISSDGRTYTFELRSDLAFADGTPCRSGAFREAIASGMNRLDHATYTWLLRSVVGSDKVRAGRPLPATIGIETPDDHTLVLRLSHPDSTLLRALAVPGASDPWRAGSGVGWRDGIGAYTITSSAPAGLTLARRASAAAGPDTLRVRFVASAARLRGLLRQGGPDLLWPLPPDLLDQPLPNGYASRSEPARPPRRLWLVMRTDVPPTTRVEARHALAYGLNRAELVGGLGASGVDLREWMKGGGPLDFPGHDPDAVRDWLERGHFGRSLHVVMSYSQDGAGRRVARTLQSGWAELALDVELRPLAQSAATAEALKASGPQITLAEAQAPIDASEAEIAPLVMPLRGPAVGGFRSGWRTREFDRWILPTATPRPLDPAWVEQRLMEEHAAIPIAELPWLWVERSGAHASCHPHFGPDPLRMGTAPRR
jgi:ABC-type transport system substrate-binding protein